MRGDSRSDDRQDSRPESDFASQYAAFSSALTVNDLDPAVTEAARVNLYDTLACAAAGFSVPVVGDLAALVTAWGGKPEATVWFTDTRVPAHEAALVNGAMAHAREYEDTHDGAVLHAGVAVVPAALAAAEVNRDATGADLVAGIASGLELTCRLGIATSIGIIESGFMYTSLLGHFGATAAAARVLRLDSATTANALGIVYSQASGTHQVTRDGAQTKCMQPGFAARSALVAVAMAAKGIRGTRMTFEGRDGLFQSYLRGNYDPLRLRDGLGARYEFLNLSYKPYPCCRLNHAAIDAALLVRSQLTCDPADITAVRCGVNRQAYEAVCTPVEIRSAPRTIVEAQFSLPYTVACALVKGHVGIGDFSDDAIRDPDLLALALRVRALPDEEIERESSRGVSPAIVCVSTDGIECSARVSTARGHPMHPLSRDEMHDKMVDCLEASGISWPDGSARRFQAVIRELEALPSAAEAVRQIIARI